MSESNAESPTVNSTNTSTADIERLVAELSSDDPVERQQAQQKLAAIGEEAVPFVLPLLKSPTKRDRWEAAKTLAPIGSPAATEALINTFCDDDTNLHWVSATALVRIGQPAVEPLLAATIARTHQGFMRQGLHHVMHDLAGTAWGRFLLPVWEALDSEAWSMAGPMAAERALVEWREMSGSAARA